MNRTRIIATTLGVMALLWLVNRDGERKNKHIESFTVTRGPVVDVLREVGVLTPQDPALIQAPFSGEIKWIIPDGTWVNKGERVVVFDEEALESQVTALRTSVVDKQQELRLEKLQADHARIAEQQRVENAKNKLKIAEIRHRILIAKPLGGTQLLELDQRVKPIEQKLEQLQTELIPLEKKYRASRAAYQSILQEWQEGRSKLLELKMKKDLRDAKKDETSTNEPSGNRPLTLEESETAVKLLQTKLDHARDQRNADRTPYEKIVHAIDEIDSKAQELYIQIEIEKRGMTATQLKIDRDIAQLRLTESQRQADAGKRALDAGAISKARYDQLVADAEAAEGRLEILDYRLEIASRPPDEDEIATSEAALAAAKRAVDNAQTIFTREMEILASNISVTQAELDQAIGELDRNGRGFPAAIRGTINMLEAELDYLDEEQNSRRAEIEKEIKRLKIELDAAEATPPHVVLAPSDGLVRLRQQDHHNPRLTDIGDRWSKGHTVAMLYTPGNMRVQVGINEVNYQRVREGMSCRVEIPALDVSFSDATVEHLSRIGRDREESHGRWVTSRNSGIIEFELLVELQQDVPHFRQGMTVLIDIETDRKNDALYLPASAIRQEGQQFKVQTKKRSRKWTTVEGFYFGDNYFVLESGLEEGATVYRTYGGAQP